MKAVGGRHAIADGVLNANIAYEFSKGKWVVGKNIFCDVYGLSSIKNSDDEN